MKGYRERYESDKELVEIGELSNFEWHLLHGKGEAGYEEARQKFERKISILNQSIKKWNNGKVSTPVQNRFIINPRITIKEKA